MRDHSVQALKNARKLRKAMSLPEVLLWQRLRRASRREAAASASYWQLCS
jgi:very-short-patch-repair endonuclease